jgi:hypothetical protein
MPMPRALMWALHEMLIGAHAGIWFYVGGAAFANILYHLGTEEQKKWAVPAAERGWGSTMVHRARRGLRCGRRADQGRAAGGRLLAHRRREAVHHLG